MPTSKVRSGVGRREPGQPHRMQHRRGERHHIGMVVRDLHHLLRKGIGPGGLHGCAEGLSGRGVDASDRVKVIGLVEFGGPETMALLGDGVHDDRPPEALGQLESLGQGVEVMAVDRSEVLQAQVAEHLLRSQDVLETRFHAVQHVIGGASETRPPHLGLDRLQRLLVAGIGADRPQLS